MRLASRKDPLRLFRRFLLDCVLLFAAVGKLIHFAADIRRRPAALGDHLGHNRYGDFFRGYRADLQSYGRVYVGELLGRDAFFSSSL